MAFLGVLCVCLLATSAAGHFCRKWGIPAVVGQLLVGIVLGAGGLQLIQMDTLLHEFSEIGVLLLLFIAGMESNLALLKKYFFPSVFVAVLGIVFPVVLGGASGVIMNLSMKDSLFIGIVLAATSVSISVEVLKELHVVNSKEGATILGASVIDDVLTIFLVSISFSLLTSTQTTLSDAAILAGITIKVVYFCFLYFAIIWGVPLLIKLSKRLYVPSAVVIMSLVICLGMSYLADKAGLSGVIGAFFAGIAIGQTKVKDSIHRNIEVVGYALFIPIFFVSVGLSVTFTSLGQQWKFILLFLIVAVASKLLGGFLGARCAHFSRASALMVGAGIVSRGEMALIILQLGSTAHFISQRYYSALVIVIILTTILSPILLKITAKKVNTD